jgi:hypothetical protein
MSARLI